LKKKFKYDSFNIYLRITRFYLLYFVSLNLLHLLFILDNNIFIIKNSNFIHFPHLRYYFTSLHSFGYFAEKKSINGIYSLYQVDYHMFIKRMKLFKNEWKKKVINSYTDTKEGI
jgi:hypothetical protein